MARHKRNPALATPGLGKDNLAGRSISPDTITAELKSQRGRLVDRFGHEHSESIFRNWSTAAIKAMGIRRVGGEL
jgi:hypothetical protein